MFIMKSGGKMKKLVLVSFFWVCSSMLFAQTDASIFARLRADIGKSPARILQENQNAYMEGGAILTSSTFMGFSWAFKNGICVRSMYGIPYDQENWDSIISEASQLYGEYSNPDGFNIYITWADKPINGIKIWMVRSDFVCYLYADIAE